MFQESEISQWGVSHFIKQRLLFLKMMYVSMKGLIYSILFLCCRVLYPLVEYEDWILDLMWFTDGHRYAIITAHNKLIVADAASGQVISTHHSSLNCILYPLIIT